MWPFLTLPFEILWQPVRITATATAGAVIWMFSNAWILVKDLAASSVFVILLIVIVGPVLAIVATVVVVVTIFVTGLTTPFVYGLAVMFRLFILAPPVWAGLRAVTGYLLTHVQKPKDEGIFAWEPLDEDSQEEILERLFGPPDTVSTARPCLRACRSGVAPVPAPALHAWPSMPSSGCPRAG